MAKELGKQHSVVSSNLKSIGFYYATENVSTAGVVKVLFQRGAAYDYWPCSQDEFQEAFKPGVVLKDWFAKFKVGKNFKQVF